VKVCTDTSYSYLFFYQLKFDYVYTIVIFNTTIIKILISNTIRVIDYIILENTVIDLPTSSIKLTII